MRIRTLDQLSEFVAAINKCKRDAWLESPNGDVFNLTSELSRYVAIGKLLSEQGDKLELFCADSADESNFYRFFGRHPEVEMQ